MRTRFIVAFLSAALGAGSLAAQAPAPRLADGQPDFSGIWMPGRDFVGEMAGGLKPGETLPIRPWTPDAGDSPASKNDPRARCAPAGGPGTAPYPWRIVQTPTRVFFRFDGRAGNEREIFLDGRQHPADPDRSWHGHSTGGYDGDTLVVDTIGFNDQFWFDIVGHPHTERLHTVERITRPDRENLIVEVTVDDAGAYGRPFTITSRSTLVPEDRVNDYVCPDR
jgi:hypothetical protein